VAGGNVIFLVAGIIAAVAGAGATITFWDSVRSAITGWLRRNGLDKSALMEAVIQFDRLAVGIRRRIRVKTPRRGVEVISEERLSIDQIDDQSLRALVARHSQVDVDILHDL
jgi:hypothetical protein